MYYTEEGSVVIKGIKFSYDEIYELAECNSNFAEAVLRIYSEMLPASLLDALARIVPNVAIQCIPHKLSNDFLRVYVTDVATILEYGRFLCSHHALALLGRLPVAIFNVLMDNIDSWYGFNAPIPYSIWVDHLTTSHKIKFIKCMKPHMWYNYFTPNDDELVKAAVDSNVSVVVRYYLTKVNFSVLKYIVVNHPNVVIDYILSSGPSRRYSTVISILYASHPDKFRHNCDLFFCLEPDKRIAFFMRDDNAVHILDAMCDSTRYSFSDLSERERNYALDNYFKESLHVIDDLPYSCVDRLLKQQPELALELQPILLYDSSSDLLDKAVAVCPKKLFRSSQLIHMVSPRVLNDTVTSNPFDAIIELDENILLRDSSLRRYLREALLSSLDESQSEVDAQQVQE